MQFRQKTHYFLTMLNSIILLTIDNKFDIIRICVYNLNFLYFIFATHYSGDYIMPNKKRQQETAIEATDDIRKRFESELCEENLKRSFIFSICIIILQVFMVISNLLKVGGATVAFRPDGSASPLQMYSLLSITLIIGGVFFALLCGIILSNKGIPIKLSLKMGLSTGALIFFVCSFLAFHTANVLSSGGIESFMNAVVILCVMPVLNPKMSIPAIAAVLFYTLGITYAARGVSDAWYQLVNTDQWISIMVVTLILSFGSVVTYNLYESNYVKSADLEAKNQQLMQMATTDQLTQISNRYASMHSFEELWTEAANNSGSIAVAMADIDFFKSYNDKFGHQEGDECLKKVSETLKDSFFRSSDIVSRYGGEEFLIIDQANSDTAFMLADRMRKNVENAHIEHATKDVSDYVTISVGVCLVTPGPGITGDDAIKKADEALYASKDNGRNRTTLVKFDD
jgi:diguanylate cyclase (GGDEF)-like protein